MIGMAAILGTMFIGISAMAYYFGIVPKGDETVVPRTAMRHIRNRPALLPCTGIDHGHFDSGRQ